MVTAYACTPSAIPQARKNVKHLHRQIEKAVGDVSFEVGLR